MTTTAKAMRLRHPASLDNLRLEQAEASDPGLGEITVRIRAGSLNFRDGLVVNGFFPARDGLIPLSDGAGEVVAVGEGVAGFAVGDAVVSTFHPNWRDGHVERSELNNAPGAPADGYACEVATRPISHFTLAPKGLSHAEAATLTCAGVTAWRAVIATSSSAEKLERLRALGADHVIDYRENEKWGEAVLALTGGLGADHIIEVGGPHTVPQSFVAARTGGHIAIIGAVGGFDIDTMPFAIVQAKRLRLQAVTVGSRRDQTDMVRAIEANAIRPVIDSSFPLDRLADAFRHLQAGGHFGKICVEI